jgi:hypothetical protein
MVFFQSKIPIWVKFGRACNRRCILWSFGLFYGQKVYFMDLWYVLWSFGIFSPVLVRCTEKNLATLLLYPPANAKLRQFSSASRAAAFRFFDKTKKIRFKSKFWCETVLPTPPKKHH